MNNGTRRIRFDPAKAGNMTSKRFLALVLSESSAAKRSLQDNIGAAVLSVALNPKAAEHERKYAFELLRDPKNDWSHVRIKELLKHLIESEKSLPEVGRNTTNILSAALNTPASDEGSFVLSVLNQLRLDSSLLNELGLISDTERIPSALIEALTPASDSKTKSVEFLRTVSIEDIAQTYTTLLADGELSAESMFEYTKLVVHLNETREMPTEAPTETREVHTEAPTEDAPPSQSPPLKKPAATVTEQETAKPPIGKLSLEEIEQHYSLPKSEERGGVPVVQQVHVDRAAKELDISPEQVPSLDTATNEELVSFAYAIAKALPDPTEFTSRSGRSLEENIRIYSTPTDDRRARDGPRIYVEHLTILVLYYGASMTSDLVQSFSCLRQRRDLLKVLRKHRISSKTTEQLKPFADKLVDLGLSDPDIFNEQMRRAAGDTSNITSIIKKLERTVRDVGDIELVKDAIRKKPSGIFQGGANFEKWLMKIEH
jgi:hypothetical protein